MAAFNINTVIYSDDTRGTLRLYVYSTSGQGYLIRQYFARDRRYLDEVCSVDRAKEIADAAIENLLEVRVTNGSDFCVFHSRDGGVIYPASSEEFWKGLK